MTTPIDQLTEALSGTAQLVAGIRPDQWADRTPCAEWDVRQLVNHLVAGNRLFTRLLQGEQMPAPADLISQGSRDQLGDDPEAAYRKSADGLVAAFAQPGALEQMVTAPIGTVPGIAALHLRITEALVHGWDLAQATGQAAPTVDALAEQELAFTQRRLADVLPGRTPFAPPRPVADDAPALDRLAALLGRELP